MKKLLYFVFLIVAAAGVAGCKDDLNTDKGAMRIIITPNPVRVELDGTFLVSAVVDKDGERIVNPKVEWSIRDGNIASVGPDGTVTGYELGQTVLVAHYSRGGEASAEVPLIVEPKLESFRFLKNRINTRSIGETINLLDYIETVPPDACRSGIRWSLDDKNVARVDEQGHVTALQRGFTSVTATAINAAGATIKKEVLSFYVLRPVPAGYVDLGLTSGTLWAEDDSQDWYLWSEASAKYGESLPTEDDWFELLNENQWVLTDGLGHVLNTQEEIDAVIEEGGPNAIVKYMQLVVDYSKPQYIYPIWRFVGPNGRHLDIRHRNVCRLYNGNTYFDFDSHDEDISEGSDYLIRTTDRYVYGGYMIQFRTLVSRKNEPGKMLQGLDWNGCATPSDIKIMYGDAEYCQNDNYQVFVRTVLRD